MTTPDAGMPEMAGAPLFLLDVLPEVDADGGELLVDGAEGRHAVEVLRIAPGERVRVGNGQGTLVEGEVIAAGVEGLRVGVRSRVEVPAPDPEFVLVQALPKGDRGPLAVDLATELGVDRIVPWEASRCVTRWRDDRVAKGLAKWRAAAHAASKQSRRPHVPEVTGLMTTREVCGMLADEIASAAQLLMGEADEGRPAVLVRGLVWDGPALPAAALVRERAADLFR